MAETPFKQKDSMYSSSDSDDPNLDISDLPEPPNYIDKEDLKECISTKDSMQLFLERIEKKGEFLRDASPHEIFNQYQLFLESLPNSSKPTSVADTLTVICCGNYCNIKFTPQFLMKARQLIPTTCSEKDTVFNVINQFQFFLVQSCIVNQKFLPKLHDIPICQEFFRRLYIIPKNRFQNFMYLIANEYKQALPHGNTGGSFERTQSSKNVAQLINKIDTIAEPHPSGTGFLMPSAMTKTRKKVDSNATPPLIKSASLDKGCQINANQILKKLDPTFHFQKANSFTKCNTCIRLKLAQINPRLTIDEQEEAKIHLKNHRNNVRDDRRDYFIRKLISLEEGDWLLSIAHDGMSKNKTKFPHLLNHNTKKLTDPLKMMCSLNIAVVHKKSIDADHQLHCFWNIDQISGARANAVISQLFYSISNCATVPSHISFQLDNCSANKCYTLFGAFGLLLWVPQLTKIYICTAEVGHTHNDVDQTFGILAKALQKEQVITPQGYARFVESKLKGIVSNNLLPTTYNFEQIVRKNIFENGQIYNNHYFELSKLPDNTVIMKIARFQRSEMYLSNKKKELQIFKVFKKNPDLSVFPPIIIPEEFNEGNLKKVCKAVELSVDPNDFEELENLPKFIKQQPAAESFENLIERIRSKIVGISNTMPVTVPLDPENEHIETYLSKIEKVWLKIDNPSLIEAAEKHASTTKRKKKKNQSKNTTEPGEKKSRRKRSKKVIEK